MAIPQLSRTEAYLRNLSLHTETCRLATEDLLRAIETAQTIPDEKLREKALKEAVVFSNKGLVLVGKKVTEATIDLWEKVLSTMKDPKTQAKLAEKIVRVIEADFPQKAEEIGKKYPAKAGKAQREKTHGPNQGQLEEISTLIAADQFEKAFKIALKVQGPVDRLEAFCKIAAKFPSNFQWPASEQKEIEPEKAPLLTSLATVRTLEPAEIDGLMSRAKKLMLRAAATGMPHVVMEIGAKANEQKVNFATIQNGLQRAACITAISDIASAQKVLAMVTLPLRQLEGAANLKKIKPV